MQRKQPLVTGNIYHVTSKSIAGYRIFNSDAEYARMIQMIRFFSHGETLPKFSQFLKYATVQHAGFVGSLQQMVHEKNKLVQIVSYCLMPTHVHLVLLQRASNGISIAVGNLLNAFARYFNVKHKRQGPLWAGKFKSIHVSSDEQLLHLMRYVHLNPTTAGLVKDAAEWKYSSYAEHVASKEVPHPLCDFQSLIDISPSEYRKFVNDRVRYQRELARIKALILE